MLLGLVGRAGQLDAARLAAAAGLDLRLDDDGAELLGRRTRLGGRLGDDAGRDRYAVLGEELLRLVLHQVHRDLPVLLCRSLVRATRARCRP